MQAGGKRPQLRVLPLAFHLLPTALDIKCATSEVRSGYESEDR
jgi:hypothetical protein